MLFSAILNTWVCYQCCILLLGKPLLSVSIFALEALRVQSFLCHSREASLSWRLWLLCFMYTWNAARAVTRSPPLDPLAQLQLPWNERSNFETRNRNDLNIECSRRLDCRRGHDPSCLPGNRTDVRGRGCSTRSTRCTRSTPPLKTSGVLLAEILKTKATENWQVWSSWASFDEISIYIRRPLCRAWGGGVREEQSMVLTAPQQWIRCHRCLFGPVPCGRVAKAPIAVCLRSGCEGVWPFRIRCQRASFLSLCKSGCPTIFAHLCAHQAAAVVRLCLRAGPLVFSSRGSKGGTSAPGEWCLSPDLGGVEQRRIHCEAAAVVRLCLRTGALFFSLFL